MDFVANLHVSEDPKLYSLANWRPGALRCDDDGIAFTQRGSTELEQLSTSDMVSVSITSHLIGADDVVVETKSGNIWSIKLSGGEKLVDALRELGVPVKG